MTLIPDPSDDGHAIFEALAKDLLTREGCARGTMMGFPCLRRDGAFFACVHRTGESLIIKLDRDRVRALVDTGDALPFSPNGRVFKEWAAIPTALHPSWSERLEEAWSFAGGTS